MCGVVAILSSEVINQQQINSGEQLVSLLKHRGPDGHDIWMDKKNGILLGHSRLAIIDLSNNAAQPMTRNGVVISFNGELYNYKEIRKILESKGHVFYSSSDTEVMLLAWIEWKEDCFVKFDGMFAVAIWDKDKLTLATDPFGEKTLYYSKTSFGWAVCSELRALKDVFNFDIELGSEEVLSFMSLGFIAAPKTAYKDTYRMLPAEIVSLNKDQTKNIRKYWKIPKFRINGGISKELSEQQLDDIADTLLTSLKRRMVSDVPLCLFLSSGVDSSLVAAMIKHELKQDIDCITVTFQDGNTNNEAIHAKELSDFLGLNFNNVIINSRDDKNLLNSLMDHFGQPFESLTSLAIASMTNSVTDNYKVGLTGFGADEVFAGYGKHDFAYKYRLPIELSNYSTSLLKKFSQVSNSHFSFIDSLLAMQRYKKYLALKTYPLLPVLEEINGFDLWAKKRYSGIDSLELEVYMEEIINILPNSRCISIDLGSMRSSMELRTPFLNKKLVEMLSKYDYRSLTAFGQKHILRKLLKRYVPSKFVDRPKQGFSFPNQWLINQEKSKNIPNRILPRNFNNLLSNYKTSRNIDKITSRALILEGFARNK
jgi:asparagine synthase (glutamine-hydrolysing)